MKPLEALVFPLLEWYNENARDLPWRADATAYHVWLSEIMLQQTRVAAVLDYYRRFLERFPTVFDLAKADEDALMKQWQGLGYYSRARNLQKAAKIIVERYGGVFPSDYDAIRALPGIGDYTAGAIGSIAFGLPRAAVDGNVLRVVTRLTGDTGNITLPTTKRRVTAALEEVIPLKMPGTFNQALMELGATVCLPNGAPLCESCPGRGLCVARQRGLVDSIPVKSPKKPRKIENRLVYLIFQGDFVLLRQRPGKGLLAGLWEFPNVLETEASSPGPETGEFIGTGKHIFSHIEWHMKGYLSPLPTTSSTPDPHLAPPLPPQTTLSPPESGDLEGKNPVRDKDALPKGYVWATAEELRHRYSVPSAFAAFYDIALRHLEERGQGYG